ncbi:hypothetical protein BCR43DRAFT_493073 [Syncephalastrum racemosum]|uniref:D-isomer specific 2-hydroxyacid dehydrogenase n=1 Tax=Syncephalastrum racemosum TaxID=13706 RepID=A0A1X2HA14_SYNRA|nr:hypothetical protein BCR43DRAFT_493073 [Syncephalastrum racemosum]
MVSAPTTFADDVKKSQDGIKILLVGDIDPKPFDRYQVERVSQEIAFKGGLLQRMNGVHALGTMTPGCIDQALFEAATSLRVIACFGPEPWSPALEASARKRGITLLNAPDRLVNDEHGHAELIIGQLISLSRQLGDRNMEMHDKIWRKKSQGCYEVRHKTLGLIGGYSTSLSVLAEALGMSVVYHCDIDNVLPFGRARAAPIERVLQSTFVCVLGDTKRWLSSIKHTCLIACMDHVESLQTVVQALHAGTLLGAAIELPCPPPAQLVAGCPNLILTPRTARWTVERQTVCAEHVTTSLLQHLQRITPQLISPPPPSYNSEDQLLSLCNALAGARVGIETSILY